MGSPSESPAVAPSEPTPRRRRLGTALLVIGLVGILWGVFHILEAANGPGTGPKTFAERRSYDMVKKAVHESFLGGFARAMAGLGLMMLGARVRRRGASE